MTESSTEKSEISEISEISGSAPGKESKWPKTDARLRASLEPLPCMIGVCIQLL